MSHPKAKPARGVRTVPVDLAALDAFKGDALGLFCWSDVRPLGGVAGYVDWRLCGALSHTLISEVFHGLVGETLLLPVTGRLKARRIFVFGLGSAQAWDGSVLRSAARRAYEVMTRAGVTSVSMGAPAWRADKGIEAAFCKAVQEEFGQQIDQVLIEKV